MKPDEQRSGDSFLLYFLLYVVASNGFGTLPFVSGFNDLIVISVCRE